MTIVAAPSAPLYPSLQGAFTALAGAGLGLTMYTATGSTQVARTTAGFVELGSSSGCYVESSSGYVAPVVSSYYRLVWDNANVYLAEEDLLVSATVQYFDVVPSGALRLDVDTQGWSGLVGAGLGLTLYTPSGSVQTARVTTPFSEVPTGSGLYFITGSYNAPSTPGKYFAIWDNNGVVLSLQDVYVGTPTGGGGGPALYAGIAVSSTQTRYSRSAKTRYSAKLPKTRYSYTAVGR